MSCSGLIFWGSGLIFRGSGLICRGSELIIFVSLAVCLSRNLCLSVVSQAVVPQTVVSQTVVAQAGIAQAEITFRDLPMLYVPSQDRSQIVGFQLVDDVLHKAETIEQPVDFSRPLASQHAFEGVVQGGADCVP